jgi:hypothetical protein
MHDQHGNVVFNQLTDMELCVPAHSCRRQFERVLCLLDQCLETVMILQPRTGRSREAALGSAQQCGVLRLQAQHAQEMVNNRLK